MDETCATFLEVANYIQDVVERKQAVCKKSPKVFNDHVLFIISSGLKDDEKPVTDFSHPNSSCRSENPCLHCTLFSTLSAVYSVFEFDGARNVGISNTRDQHSKANLDKGGKTDSASPPTHYQSVTLEDWFFEASKLLLSKGITKLLIKCLKKSCKFTSFLAKKAIVVGIQRKHFEVSCVLSELGQEWTNDFQQYPVLLEILRDLMSGRLFRDKEIGRKTFSFIQKLDFQNLIQNICGPYANFHINNTGMYYCLLSLIHKVVKYGMVFSDTNYENDMYFACSTVNELLVPNINAFFSMPISLKGHAICSKCLKVLNTLLGLKFLENKTPVPVCVTKLSATLQTADLLHSANEKSLLVPVNFMGVVLAASDKRTCVSPLMRSIILVKLKAKALILKGGKGPCRNGLDMLSQFWDEVGHLTGQFDSDQKEDWLPKVFGDQDDLWIAALFSLLVIHKELTKWLHISRQDQSSLDKENTDGVISSLSQLLPVICPHKLFLQLAHFIGFDHLVLTDFLCSPETAFLPYFLQYLHFVRSDWNLFKSAVSNSERHGAQEEDVILSDSSDSTFTDTYGSEKIMKKSSVSSESDMHEGLGMCQQLPHYSQVAQFSETIHRHQGISSRERPESSNHPCAHKYPLTPKVMTNLKADQTIEDTSAQKHSDQQCESISSSRDSDLHSVDGSHKPSDQNKDINSDHKYIDLSGKESTIQLSGLVSYSDSESDNDLEPENSGTETPIHNRKRPLSSDSDEDKESDKCAMKNLTSNADSGRTEINAMKMRLHLGEPGNDDTKSKVQLDQIMGMLIRLRLHAERLEENNIFPYNARPLLLLLERCENLYEQ